MVVVVVVVVSVGGDGGGNRSSSSTIMMVAMIAVCQCSETYGIGVQRRRVYCLGKKYRW